jgi:hypothetical protein
MTFRVIYFPLDYRFGISLEFGRFAEFARPRVNEATEIRRVGVPHSTTNRAVSDGYGYSTVTRACAELTWQNTGCSFKTATIAGRVSVIYRIEANQDTGNYDRDELRLTRLLNRPRTPKTKARIIIGM